MSTKPRKSTSTPIAVEPGTGNNQADTGLMLRRTGADRDDPFILQRANVVGEIVRDKVREGRWTLTMRMNNGNDSEPNLVAVGDIPNPPQAFMLFTALFAELADANVGALI